MNCNKIISLFAKLLTFNIVRWQSSNLTTIKFIVSIFVFKQIKHFGSSHAFKKKKQNKTKQNKTKNKTNQKKKEKEKEKRKFL